MLPLVVMIGLVVMMFVTGGEFDRVELGSDLQHSDAVERRRIQHVEETLLETEAVGNDEVGAADLRRLGRGRAEVVRVRAAGHDDGDRRFVADDVGNNVSEDGRRRHHADALPASIV